VDRLRSPGGCPWDRAQTIPSVAPFVLEEAYEVVDAIAGGEVGRVAEEAGDLLMVLFFLGRIAEESGPHSIGASAESVAAKLVRRHPHVFGDVKVSGVGDVLRNWETIKREEKEGLEDRSAIAGVPAALPALLRAFRTGEKAARVGFDWADLEGAARKVEEEWAEFREAASVGDPARIEEELGDLLFAAAACGRKAGANAEIALRRAVERFGARFRWLEANAPAPLGECDPATLQELWRRSKGAEG